MLFSGLSKRLQEVIGSLRNRGRLSEKDVKDVLRQIKLVLLEADVNFKVVKDFVAQLQERCVGAEVLGGLSPGQNVIKIVNDELTRLLGSENTGLIIEKEFSSYILVGLQGMGKTTSAAKLARYLKKSGRRPALVSLDTYRPAAMAQLELLAAEIEVDFIKPQGEDPVTLARAAMPLVHGHYDTVIFDTAGRLHVDTELMNELNQVHKLVNPTESLLVVDAMIGQDAVSIAQSFSEQGLIDSIILTKLDSDTRGGAALSMRAITGKPIKFVGLGEKTGQLELFHPQRMASQILGMGDVLTLIEKAQASFDEEKARGLQEKLRSQQFDLDDFRDQLRQFQNMGPVDQLMGLLPGGVKLGARDFDERELLRFDAIISSMTKLERQRPELINGSRRKRIAKGSGTNVQQVNKLLKQFAMMQKMFKQLDPKALKKGKLPFPLK